MAPEHTTVKNRHESLIIGVLMSFFLLLTAPRLVAQEVDYEQKFREYGLVDVQEVVPSIMVRLMYSTEDNFMHKDVYGSLEKAYLTPDFADRMRQAQELLHKERGTDYSLIIYDAARPHSIQSAMWKAVQGTPNVRYVASPGRKNGGHALLS